jgi:endoglucanase
MPDVWSSYLYAGVAARASYVLRQRSKTLSGQYLESALRAMSWSEKERANHPDAFYPYQVRDARNLAAAELFRATGKKEWHDLFLDTTVFKNADKLLYMHGSHDHSDAALVYSMTDKPGMNPVVKRNCKAALLAAADRLILGQSKTGFRWTKDHWRPAIGGTFSTPNCIPIVYAHIITGKKEYLQAAVLAAQTGAGANPLNMSYTTGVGHKYPKHALHWDARITGQPPPPGLTVEGPLDVDHLGGWQSPLHTYSGQFCYPSVKEWPVIENYWDVFWYPMMCEYTIFQTIAPNVFVWGYLAARK